MTRLALTRRLLTLSATFALSCDATNGPGKGEAWGTIQQAVCSAPVPEKEVFTVSIPLPPQFSAGDVTLLADDTIELRDVDIPGASVNMGLGDCTVYSGAVLGSLYCRGVVDLRDNSTVQGGIFTTTEEITQGTVTYDPMAVDTDYAFEPEREVRLNFPMPPNLNGKPNVWVDPNQTAVVAPGDYNRMDLRNNARVTLSPGVYWVNELSMEPTATFSIDTAACTAGGAPCSVVFGVAVRVTPALRGFASGVNPEFLLIYGGSEEVLINTQFSGFIIAMNAHLRFNNDVPHSGAFFARSIVVDAGQVITHRPFVPSVFEVWEP